MTLALICEIETDTEIVGVVTLFGSSSKAYQPPGARERLRVELAVTAVAVPVAHLPDGAKLTPASQRKKPVLPGSAEYEITSAMAVIATVPELRT